MNTVNSEIIMQGNNDAWFTANASVIYPANIQIFHINGRYKFSDGVTTLSALPFLGALGYTPENIANKQNSLAVDGTGNKYVTVDAINANVQTKQVITIITASAPTVNVTGFRRTFLNITAQSGAINLSTNLTGTKQIGDVIIVQIKDNGTAVAITMGTLFQALGNGLPTTTIASKYLTIGASWNGTKYGVLAVDYES